MFSMQLLAPSPGLSCHLHFCAVWTWRQKNWIISVPQPSTLCFSKKREERAKAERRELLWVPQQLHPANTSRTARLLSCSHLQLQHLARKKHSTEKGLLNLLNRLNIGQKKVKVLKQKGNDSTSLRTTQNPTLLVLHKTTNICLETFPQMTRKSTGWHC